MADVADRGATQIKAAEIAAKTRSFFMVFPPVAFRTVSIITPITASRCPTTADLGRHGRSRGPEAIAEVPEADRRGAGGDSRGAGGDSRGAGGDSRGDRCGVRA